MAERGVEFDHATLYRWVVKFAPVIASRAQERKRPTATSWRMDKTYIKVKGPVDLPLPRRGSGWPNP